MSCHYRHIKTGLVSLLAVSVMAGAASSYAQTSRIYFAGYLGLSKMDGLDFEESTSGQQGDIEYDNTISFAGALGLRLSPQVRLEAELSYRKADANRMEFSDGQNLGGGGEIKTYGGLLNLFYDFDVPWDLKPYVSAGLGYAYHRGEIDDQSSNNVDVSTNSGHLIWQGGGGARYRLSPSTMLSGGYRYTDGTDLDFGSYTIDYESHEFRIGLEYDIPVK